MIRGYSDHAANERTFLAWVRTGIAVMAFGFVVEKFNLLVLTIASANPNDVRYRSRLDIPTGALGRYDGLVLIVFGLILIVVATIRFIRTGRLLDDEQTHSAGTARTELILSGTLASIVVAVHCVSGAGAMNPGASTAP